MAIVQFSGIVNSIRGKVSGSVFQLNRAGTSLRSLVNPSNNSSLVQKASQAQFGRVAASWRMMDNSTKDTVNSYAAQLTWYNRFGEAYVPSGFQYWVYLCRNIYMIAEAGYPSVTTWNPPAPQALEFYGWQAYEQHFFMTANLTGTASEVIKLFCSRRCSVGSAYNNQTMIFVTYFAADSAAGLDLYEPIQSKMNYDPTAGGGFWMRAEVVDFGSGQQTFSGYYFISFE